VLKKSCAKNAPARHDEQDSVKIIQSGDYQLIKAEFEINKLAAD